MKVVILGGCGFLGLHTAHQFIQNNTETVLIDSPERLPLAPAGCDRIGIAYPYQDLATIESVLGRGDVLIHLGWSKVPNADADSFATDMGQNALFSAALFQQAVKAQVAQVIFASSGGSVYGNVSDPRIHEGHPTKPISSYGIGKLAAEHYLDMMAMGSQTRPVSFRIGNAYGTHRAGDQTPTGLIPFAVQSMLDDREIEIWGDGQVVRDFIHVTDIARAFSVAAGNPTIRGVFNLGTGVGTAIADLIGLLESRLNRSARISWGKSRPCDVQRVVLDSNRFRDLTGWQPTISLEQGVDQIISGLNHS